MKHPLLLPLFALTLALNPLSAQSMLPVPEPEKPQSDLPVRLDAAAPIDSLERQVATASFDQRGALATAYDVANRSIDERVAELRAQGLILSPEASTNLATVRDNGRQVFRDLSLTTEETWRDGRHNGVMALRKIQTALATLQKTATLAQ